MELTYHRKGDYLFPNLMIEEEEVPIGKYGMLRRSFLKENRKGWYQGMLLSGQLDRHLMEIVQSAKLSIHGCVLHRTLCGAKRPPAKYYSTVLLT